MFYDIAIATAFKKFDEHADLMYIIVGWSLHWNDFTTPMHVGTAMKFSSHLVCVGLQISSPMCNRYPTTWAIHNTATRFLSDNFSTNALCIVENNS